MPHIWEMFARLFQATSGGDTPPLIVSVISAAALTLGIAAVGWVIGVAVGMLLGIVMQRWRLAEWGLLPWIVVSQTVPLIAFAPVVNALGTQIARGGPPWPQWLSVAIIASYLAFFPVAVRALPGSTPRTASTSTSCAPTRHATAQPCCGCASRPRCLPAPALRLAAANAVVGARRRGVDRDRGGIGRMLIQLAGQGSSDLRTVGSTFGSIAMGLVAAGSVAILVLVLAKYRRGEAT